MTLPFSEYDARHYVTLNVVTGYAEWSQSYDAKMGDELDIDLLTKLETIQWSQIRKVIDLGCGTGRIGSWLKAQGVRSIIGVDICEAMLRQAAVKGVYDNLIQADITSLPGVSYEQDLGISALAACHLSNLKALFQEANKIIHGDGMFILADYHPFFLLKGIPTNFERPSGESIAIENYVHLLSDHVQAARQTNWRLVEMHERLVDKTWVEKAPSMSKYLHQPISFVMVWQRP
jgi:SAM-dependent methyltransferase